MKKISGTELKKIKTKFQYYDFDNFNSKYQLKIVFRSEIDFLTYSDLSHDFAKIETYKENEEQIINLCQLLLSSIESDKCIVYKYNEVWFVNRKKSSKLRKIFRENDVKLRNTPAVEIDINSKIIELLIRSSLRYNSFVQFLLLEKRMVFTVTDHMDVFINLEQLGDSVLIEQILEEYNGRNREEIFVIEKNFEDTDP